MESPEELADISHFMVKRRVDYANKKQNIISISIFSLSVSHKTQKGFRVVNFKQVICLLYSTILFYDAAW